MVCSISLDISSKAQKVRQASTLSEPCRGGATSYTDKQSVTTKEKKKKVTGAHTLCCDMLTYLTDYVVGCHRCRQIAHQRKPWIIVLTDQAD